MRLVAPTSTSSAPAFGHHVGYPKRTADLDEFPAGNDNFPAAGDRVQRDQHRGGIVVDHQRGLGPDQIADNVFHERIPTATRAALQVKLEVAVMTGAANQLLGPPPPTEVSGPSWCARRHRYR